MNLLDIFLLNSSSVSEQINYTGAKSWVYYLLGAIFLVLFFISMFYVYKWRHSHAQHEHALHTYGQFKAFWLKNRFAIMILFSVVLFLCGIFFMLMNTVLLT